MCNHKRKFGHKPNASCKFCWYKFLTEKPDNVITARDLSRFLQAVGFKVMDFKVDQMWANCYDYQG